MKEVTYKPGDVIFQEGDESAFVYRVVSGTVEVVKQVDGQTLVLGTIGEGEFVGEMGVVESRVRSATVRAASDVTVEVIDADLFFQLISDNKHLAYNLILRLSERLRTADRKLVEVSSGGGEDLLAGLEKPPQPRKPTDDYRLTLHPDSEEMRALIPNGGLPLTRFPFAVGRSPGPQEPRPDIDISLAIEDSKPYRLSRKHFVILPAADRFVLRDLGSFLGTDLNGEYLGHHFASDSAALRIGENSIVAGGVGSPFAFKVEMSKLAS